MKILISLLLATAALSTAASAATLENLSCGNSKMTVNITQSADQDGVSTDTLIEMNYVGYNGTLQGLFNSNDPSFQPDAQGFQQIYLNGPHEDSQFFTGKIKIDPVNLQITVNGYVQNGSHGAQLPVQASYVCAPVP